jgi:Tfp pilus assembly protein PilF
MKELFRRPLVMALILGALIASGYALWIAREMWRLGNHRVAATFFTPAAEVAETIETVEAVETAKVAQAIDAIEAVDPPQAVDAAPIAIGAPAALPPPASEQEARTKAQTEAPALPTENGVVFIAHARRSPIATPLEAARSALAKGDVEAARQQFSALLKADPYHLEALLGEASIALRQNAPKTAWRFYQMAWTAHPQDARVQAGMLGMLSAAGQIDPQSAEGRLKNLIAQQPQAAAPHFALGNLLAGQGRWAEAQAAYFEACRQDATNPDYRFNLAVSLDTLRHPELAAAHYRAALAAAQTAPASFILADVQARLNALQHAEEQAKEETP